MITRRTLLASAGLGFLGTLPLTRIASGQAAHRLTIIHMNDFHSKHEPVNAAVLACSAGETCFGGSARLATVLAALKAAAEADGRAVLLLDAGDQFQGSLFYTALHGAAELAVMHAIGTECMAVGNHEFDNGPPVLARFIREARFPVVSANIDAGGELTGLIRPYALFDRAGLRIGVVGLTTEETRTSSSPGPDVRFNPPAPALAAAAAAARAEGAETIIVLSHLGLPLDRDLAGAGADADVIIGGHTHTLLSNVEAGAAGPHPVVAGRTLIVQAGAYGRYLGRLDLDIAADGTVLAHGGECRHIGLDVPPDPAVTAIVAGYAAPLDELRRRVVGTLPAPASVTFCRMGECELGNLVADAMRDADHGGDVALANAGGLRTGLPGGTITYGDLIGVLPFGNTLATCKVSGDVLRAAVLHGLGLAGKGAFPQVSGMRIAWNPANLDGTEITIRQTDGSYAALQPDRMYGLATNNFVRGGGDGYTMLRDAAVDAYDTGPPLEELVAQRLAAGSAPLERDGRISLKA